MSRYEEDDYDEDFPNPDDSCWTCDACDQSDARQESLMEAPDWFEMAGADDE